MAHKSLDSLISRVQGTRVATTPIPDESPAVSSPTPSPSQFPAPPNINPTSTISDARFSPNTTNPGIAAPSLSDRSRDGLSRYTAAGIPIYRLNAPSLRTLDRSRELSFGSAVTEVSNTSIRAELEGVVANPPAPACQHDTTTTTATLSAPPDLFPTHPPPPNSTDPHAPLRRPPHPPPPPRRRRSHPAPALPLPASELLRAHSPAAQLPARAPRHAPRDFAAHVPAPLAPAPASSYSYAHACRAAACGRGALRWRGGCRVAVAEEWGCAGGREREGGWWSRGVDRGAGAGAGAGAGVLLSTGGWGGDECWAWCGWSAGLGLDGRRRWRVVPVRVVR
ncbi:uncharacterized protein K441DRAFT_719208 [Cenococcum geophilum 1.58]|uniref:uncharacterized protein n=1 Tax=Cenococcum geophilum 1.58 TaxID=794803 RepID=UPI003590251F|nr:hypothetical protein K441DRAFT_719208 [Cenococcum geophilum 1.58]